MKSWGTLLAVLAAGCFSPTGLQASVDTNPGTDTDYRTIIDRNPFGLKPQPPPQTNAPPATAPPKTDIKLTGFTVFGQKKAYFMVTTAGKQEFYTLASGESKDGLEVVEIDDAAKSVRVRNGGIDTVMTFATHGNAIANTAPAPVNPGAPGAPGAGANPAVTTAYNMPAAPGMPPNLANTIAGGRTAIPSRTLRTQTGMGADAGMVRTYGGMPGLTTTPNQNVGNFPVITAPAPPNPNNLSGEQQILLLELQKVAAQKGNPRAVLPPTPGLPGLPGQ